MIVNCPGGKWGMTCNVLGNWVTWWSVNVFFSYTISFVLFLLTWFAFIHVQVSMKTEVTWLRDVLRGDDVFELQVKLLKHVPEEYPYKDDEWICFCSDICSRFLLLHFCRIRLSSSDLSCVYFDKALNTTENL